MPAFQEGAVGPSWLAQGVPGRSSSSTQTPPDARRGWPAPGCWVGLTPSEGCRCAVSTWGQTWHTWLTSGVPRSQYWCVQILSAAERPTRHIFLEPSLRALICQLNVSHLGANSFLLAMRCAPGLPEAVRAFLWEGFGAGKGCPKAAPTPCQSKLSDCFLCTPRPRGAILQWRLRIRLGCGRARESDRCCPTAQAAQPLPVSRRGYNS